MPLTYTKTPVTSDKAIVEEAIKASNMIMFCKTGQELGWD
jgi:hypothetical protein